MQTIAVQEGQSPFATQAVTVGAVQADQSVMPSAGQGVNDNARWSKDLLSRLVDMFESSEEATDKPRRLAERDVDYYDNKQWTEEEAKELRKRGQPVQMKNRIRQKVKYLQGLEQQQRTDPRALPRTPRHDFDANDCTDALRFIVESNRYDQIRSQFWWDLVVPGWSGYSVTVEQKPPYANPRVSIKRTRWDRMFWDPYSSAVDYSDASYLGEVLWMDRDEAKRTYGAGAAKVFDETVSSAQVGGTFDDKPKDTTWVAFAKRYRVRIVKMYYIGENGEWQFCEFTKGGYLKAGPSPWIGEDGKPEHEYVWRSAYVDRDNARYGDIRDLIDLQDGINKRSSKLLHLATVRQTFSNSHVVTDVKEFQRQAARPDGHFEGQGNAEFGKDYGVVPTADIARGQSDILMMDLNEMEQQGANAAMLGNAAKDASGRAVLANQAGGALAISPLLDTAKDADHEVYRKAWRRVKQFWTAEEWVRVTDDDKSVRWVGMNTPMMMDPMTGQPIEGQPQPGQPAMPMMDPKTGQPAMRNQVAELDIDIIIDDAPHVGTMQQEEFAKLAELGNSPLGQLKSYPKLLIQASSFRSKPDMLRELSQAEQQPQQPPPEVLKMQAQLQLEQQKAQMQMELKQQELQADQAKAAAELQMEQQKQEQQLAFEARKAALELQFAREKFELEQAARAQAARDRHDQSQQREEAVN